MSVQTIEWQRGLAADTNRHPSPSIWADCPVAAIKEDPSVGVHVFEDFIGFGKTTAVSSNVGRYAGDAAEWISWEDTSCTITQLIQSTPDSNGVARLSITTTGNKADVLEYGYGTAYSSGSTGGFIYTDGSGGKLWFEARVRFNSIATNSNTAFIGLAQSGVAVVPAAATSTTTLFDSASAVGNVDLLGFDVLFAAPSTLRSVYGITSAARTSAGTAQTLVAATWYKLGFLIDPGAQFTKLSSGVVVRKKMRWFIDGVEVQSLSDTSTSPFPTAKVLNPAIHFMSGTSGTAGYTMDVDFIRAAQVYPG